MKPLHHHPHGVLLRTPSSIAVAPILFQIHKRIYQILCVVAVWQDEGDVGSTLQISVGGSRGAVNNNAAGRGTGPSLLSEEALFLHSLSAPTISGVGIGGFGIGGGGEEGGGPGGGGVTASGGGSRCSGSSKADTDGRRAEEMMAMIREQGVALPPLFS